MIRSIPQVSDMPMAIRAYRPPTRAPVSAAWMMITCWEGCSTEALRRASAGGSSVSPALRALQLGCGDLLRPDHHPIATLDLLDSLGGLPEVVLLRVEGQLAVERGLCAALV